jgi:hypothetical protein
MLNFLELDIKTLDILAGLWYNFFTKQRRVEMRHIKFLNVEGGMHGGMRFSPQVHVYKRSPTRRNPNRYEHWFSKPTQVEVKRELDKRCKRGWQDDGKL